MRSIAFLRSLPRLILLCCAARTGLAADLEARRAIPANAALVLEIEAPAALFENAFAAGLWGALRESSGIERGLAAPATQRLRGAALFIEKSLERNWRSAIAKLTAGGIVIAIEAPLGADSPNVVVVVTADDAQTLARLIEAVKRELERANADAPGARPGEAGRAALTMRPHGELACYQVGEGHFSLSGNRLLASNSRAALEAALDRLSGSAKDPGFQMPSGLDLLAPGVGRPRVQLTVNLRQLLGNQKGPQAVQLPAADLAAAALLGGYIDLVQRAEHAALALVLEERGLEMNLALSAGSRGRFAGIEGFFAGLPAAGCAPLLKPPGTLASATWYRDYLALWQNQERLLSAEAAQALKRHTDPQRPGADQIALAELLQSLGPHWRLVIARAQGPHLADRPLALLPAAALAIDLRDEARFRMHVLGSAERLAWAVSLATAGDLQTALHHGTKVTSIQPGQAALASAQPFAASIKPSYAVHRGHAIVGSNDGVVRGVIDELERQAEPAAALQTARPTDETIIDLAELAAFLEPFKPHLTAQAMRDRRLPRASAEHEFEILLNLLRQLERFESRTILAEDQFQIRARIGPSATRRAP
jgi:hypothetical protein